MTIDIVVFCLNFGLESRVQVGPNIHRRVCFNRDLVGPACMPTQQSQQVDRTTHPFLSDFVGHGQTYRAEYPNACNYLEYI